MMVVSSLNLWKNTTGILLLKEERISPASFAFILKFPDLLGSLAFPENDPVFFLSSQPLWRIALIYKVGVPSLLSFTENDIAQPAFFEFGL